MLGSVLLSLSNLSRNTMVVSCSVFNALATAVPLPSCPIGSKVWMMRTTALGGALLHSMASYYRVQLAYAKTAYRCQYSLPIAATVINRPALLYAACGYTLLLAHLALLIRLRVLRAVGINRTGSVLSTCAMVQNSLLKSLVDDGGSKSENKFMKAAEAIKDKIRLGTRETAQSSQHTYADDSTGTKSKFITLQLYILLS